MTDQISFNQMAEAVEQAHNTIRRADMVAGQMASRGWQYEVNAAQKPIVGRVYARLKLAGVKPTPETASAQPWTLDLTRVE